MRILEIRFKNLNSLAGEWLIDFTHPAYAADGIFAITGPTGSGKTTILDALCLALYGCTPRLSRVTKGGNEIMSRQTGACFAEAVFETPAGRYRCHWSQHRARKRPAGELQPPRHEVAEADSGKLLHSRLRDTAAYIAAATGMDFERFTRSMLLAQGGFAAFLQAPPDARAPILEQITGTGVYSRISMKVHQLRSAEHGKLERMAAELEGLPLLSDEERQALARTLEARERAEADLARRVETVKKAVAWREELRKLGGELGVLEKQQQDFERRKKDFEPLRVRLDRARRARELEADAARAATLAAEQEKETTALAAARRQLPELESALERAARREKSAVQDLEGKRRHRQSQAAVIRQVREMDVHIENRRSRVGAMESVIHKAEKQCQAYRSRISQLEASIKERQAAIAETDGYLERFAADAGLVEDMTAIGRLFESIKEKDAILTESRRALQHAAGQAETAVQRQKQKEAVLHRSREQRHRDRDAFVREEKRLSRLLDGRRTSDWHEQLSGLKERWRLLERLEEILQHRRQTGRAAADASTRIAELKSETMVLSEKIEGKQREEDALKKEVRHLETEVSLRVRIHSLEEERCMLEDGRPCPLCGALEHPYAAGNVPPLDACRTALQRARRALEQTVSEMTALRLKQTGSAKDLRQAEERLGMLREELAADEKQCREIRSELGLGEAVAQSIDGVARELSSVGRDMAAVSGTIRKIEDHTTQRETLRKALEASERVLADAEKAFQEARHRQDTAGREHRRLVQECASMEKQVAGLLQEARQTLQVYDVGDVSLARLDGLFEMLARRRDSWQRHRRERRESEKILAALEKDLEKQQALLGRMEDELHSRRQEHRSLARQLAEGLEKRRALYGRRNPDHEEKRLDDEVRAAEKALEAVRHECAALVQKTGRVKEQIRLLASATRDRAAELDAARRRLLEKLRGQGFADEGDFRSACLPAGELEELSQQEKDLEQENTRLRARLADKKAILKARRRERITQASLADLTVKLSAAEAARADVQQQIGALREQLGHDRRQRRKRRAHLEQIERQQKECARWDALHDLIGSADGKKYRNFAQGLTFEIMIAHANGQLTGMTDRYLLIRDARQPLELSVIDSYQAGEIRSTKNLSGGESFIVSLALALGLSQMASRNVRVDSLFLDEGFGTLDEDALETALETLAGLQQEGKLIGVISHVPALRERIATQIRVIREAGGRSRIEGPGCRQMGGPGG